MIIAARVTLILFRFLLPAPPLRPPISLPPDVITPTATRRVFDAAAAAYVDMRVTLYCRCRYAYTSCQARRGRADDVPRSLPLMLI